CRKVLGCSQDAEDAFQTTFLLLANKAGASRKGSSVGPWLHGAAHRIAVRTRVRASRRQAGEKKAHRPQRSIAEAEVEVEEQRRALHQEIDRLPEWLRAPILLCYLDG